MMNVFYKFRKHGTSQDLARTLRIISERKIYAARIEKFNDPSEGFFLKAHDSDDDKKTAEFIDSQIRVVSVCRFYSNALLWSYYADSYSGVCLALSFPEDDPLPVIYSGLGDSVVSDRDLGGHSHAAQKHMRRKLDYWKHEVEYRVIRVAESKEDQIYAPCKVHGALFGSKTPENIRSIIQEIGKSVNPDFFTDEVRLHAGKSHPCLGANLGVRASEMNEPQWLRDGAGPINSRPQGNTCSHCGEQDHGDTSSGLFLEEHLITGLENPNYHAEEHTILLCPNCHRRAHLSPGLNQSNEHNQLRDR
jgi:hypothetical protein